MQDSRIAATEAVNATQGTQIATLQTQQTVATHTTQIAQNSMQIAQQSIAIGNLQSGMSVLQSQVGALQAGQAQLFDLVTQDRRESRRGVAAAVAMSDAPVPSEPGKTSYVFNLATFRGQQAIGVSLAHRLNSDTPVAITFGFSQARGRNTAIRVGVAGEF